MVVYYIDYITIHPPSSKKPQIGHNF